MNVIYKDFLHRVKNAKNVKIYGAGKFAKTLYYLFNRKGIKVEAFVVADTSQNPAELFQKPVIALENLEKQEDYSLVVGVERKETTRKILENLLAQHIKNIIIVPASIVNDIYCNFVINEESIKIFMENLANEKKVIVYVADRDGNLIIRYMQNKGVQIDAICTEKKELLLDWQMPILSFEQLGSVDKNTIIILTMGNPDWQRGFVSRLRSSGFERIVLLSAEIKEAIENDFGRMIWEEKGADFQVINTQNVEQYHYIVQKEKASKVYRWRIAARDHYTYTDNEIESIRKGSFVEEYERLFPNCCFCPYDEVPFCKVDSPDINIEIYLSKCHKDKKIAQQSLPAWLIPIQVGKALTDIRIAEVCDNTGDNISMKNTDYSEGTALYWIWKNTHGQDYVGLFHYRRQMAMGKASLYKLMQYDVLLTVPTYIPMSTKEFFCTNFILEYDWNLMMKYIKEYDEFYYKTALKHEKAHSYFPCNIFIMRREYFDEMCEFIFGVLEKVDGYYENIHMVRKDRYLGYLVENLLSIYMMHHAADRNIAYTDMKYYYPIEESTF